jgi:hypothetical protein
LRSPSDAQIPHVVRLSWICSIVREADYGSLEREPFPLVVPVLGALLSGLVQTGSFRAFCEVERFRLRARHDETMIPS